MPICHSSLVKADRPNIERVQKAAFQVILGSDYSSYGAACLEANLLTLEGRRKNLCTKFALKAFKNTKHVKWFKVNTKVSLHSALLVAEQQDSRIAPLVICLNF